MARNKFSPLRLGRSSDRNILSEDRDPEQALHHHMSGIGCLASGASEVIAAY